MIYPKKTFFPRRRDGEVEVLQQREESKGGLFAFSVANTYLCII